MRKPYAYVKMPTGAGSVKRNVKGDVVARTLVGTEEDFKQVEASRFLAKLNGITQLNRQR